MGKELPSKHAIEQQEFADIWTIFYLKNKITIYVKTT